MSYYRHESYEEWEALDAMAQQAAHAKRMDKHRDELIERLAKEKQDHDRERVIEESEAERQYDADRWSA